jgi:hypothetical protein
MRSIRPVRITVLGLLLILSSGCSQWSWNPARWFDAEKSAPAPEVQVLTIEGTSAVAGDRFVQRWDGARLIVDVHSAGGTGSALFKPATAQGWPPRLAVRVHSHALAQFEALGAQNIRMTFGSAPLTEPALIDLPHGVYRRESPQLEIRWSAQ